MTSIIITLYNGEQFIEETIRSAENQDSDIEIIVVDDCSTDSSVEHVLELQQKDPRIKLIKNKNNKGFCASANEGIIHSKGEYILVLGQDDILEPNHVKAMLKCFNDDTVVMAFCDYVLIDEDGHIYNEDDHCKHSNMDISDFFSGNALPSPGLVIKRSVLEEVGLYYANPQFRNYGEYHTWIRLAQKGEIIFCEDVRARYRRHRGNITNSFTDKRTKKLLYRYKLVCKEQILKDKNIKFKDKVYIVYTNLKEFIKICIT